MSAPLPDFSTTLRRWAAGEIPSISNALPAELRDVITEILPALREASQAAGEP